MEEWKDIKGYEGLYAISNYGRIKSYEKSYTVGYGGVKKQKERILKLGAYTHGYVSVSLCKNGEKIGKRVHRLVAESFIPNPENKPIVNHKNSNRSDNRIENLEWCASSENAKHGFDFGNKRITQTQLKNMRKSLQKRVIDNKTGIIYDSITDAAMAIKMNRNHLCRCLRGVRTNYTSLEKLNS